MILKNSHIILLLITSCYLQDVFAQSSKDACMNDVKLIYRKFKLMGNAGVPKDKTWYFNYTVRTATKDSLDTGVFASDISMWASGKYLQVKSKEMEMYQNPDDAFIVIPQRKQLVRLDPYYKNEQDKNALNSYVNMIQDTLFALSKVMKCEFKNNKKTIVLELTPKGKQFLNIRSVTFVINTQEQQFETLRINYDRDSGSLREVVYVEYNFNEVDYDYKAKRITENLGKKFLKSTKEPSDSYKGYTLVDSRQKKVEVSGKQWK